MENTDQVVRALQEHASVLDMVTKRLAGIETQLAASVPIPGTPVMNQNALFQEHTKEHGPTYKGKFPQFHGFAMEDHLNWLRKIEQDFRIYRIHDCQEKIAVAGRCFEDLASTWFLRAEREYPVGFNNSWEYFRERFIETFSDTTSDYDVRTEVSAMKYNSRLPFDKFCAEFSVLVAKAQTMTEAEKVHAFINAMLPNCKKKLLLSVPKTLHEATIIARRVEFVDTRGTFQPRRDYRRDNDVVPMQLGKMEGQRVPRRTINCFRCGQAGHIARVCTALKPIGPSHAQIEHQSVNPGNLPQ